ncbi:IS110 family transposase [Synechococcus sp. CBW1002]|jgi:transposase|uniref:IS110 family transposase n=1 Tax=Synechococcus sp. CBW1002 TaxID=1353134 RepID=UPI0018CCD9A4|nr:IS110 family transposase [Synechococcus sp. CBW1002]QPN58855.1 IS110 family transposase [Synechococcus sp. CBW1002]QPN59099.1 IS110 family transposase [Synechococcus sp. CBW1002]QPN59773.1 IS110 family transposase [Synechococcus sp. CBW1002]QPN61012.1 IS110 family transposase [Synechococcus sp. CBW1002]
MSAATAHAPEISTGHDVVVGIDTHKLTHMAVALGANGGWLGSLKLDAKRSGYQELIRWAAAFGSNPVFAVEGTGCYGAGLCRALQAAGMAVVEVNRPDRSTRRRIGKDDTIDAEAAARACIAGTASVIPKAGDALVEMIRMLKVAKDSATANRTAALNQLHAIVVTAPAALRERLQRLKRKELLESCTGLRSGEITTPQAAAKMTLRILARRIQQLDEELKETVTQLDRLTMQLCPELRNTYGVGVDISATLVVAVGDNQERMKSEASFAALCGVNPLPASSGKVVRHRLNRSGNRQANCALHRIVICRLQRHQQTREYVERRTAEGRSMKEIIRCLKRFVAREVFGILRGGPAVRTATA